MSSLSPATLILAAGLVLATLIPQHLAPQTVFFGEFALAAALIVSGWRGAPGGARVNVPVIALTALLTLCLAFWPGRAGGVGYALYAALFGLAYLRGAGTRETGFVPALAWAMLICALLQSLAGVAQLAGWSLGGLVMQKIYQQAFGNVGQANHYGDLIYLGLASLAWFYGEGRLRAGAAVPCAAWLALAAAASASRSVWLYIVVFAALGCWAQWRGSDAARRTGRALLMTVACSLAAQFLAAQTSLLAHFGAMSSFERAGDASSNGQRLYNWYAGWRAMWANPWLGEGPGTFYKASIDAMFATPPAGYPKFAEHAHNLFLNLGAELGLPMALLVVAAFAWWALRHLRAAPAPTSIWALACVGVVGAHSMVEYPLWYVYFLVPVALCMGAADGADTRLPVLQVSRRLALLIWLAGVGALGWMAHDWLAVRSAYVTLAPYGSNIPLAERLKAREALARLGPQSVFALHAESLRLQSWRPDEAGAEQIAADCDAHWQYKPGWFSMMSCGEAYALTGNADALDRLTKAFCDGFPYHREYERLWAKGFDDLRVAPVRIGGRNCLETNGAPAP
ncbi:MAG: Wzy polymerase domain-containing protein [Candidatus Dactylopiibacterium sp.]|nr:Wzy polymerase domain-containing protein [Candidatus Dactylopiibacterium sp.]